MKDGLDNLTIELPFYKRPLKVLERLLSEKPDNYMQCRSIQNWERLTLQPADLEMLCATCD
jgi:hypothetical protein